MLMTKVMHRTRMTHVRSLLCVFMLLIICATVADLVAVDEPARLSDVVTLPARPRPFYKVFFKGLDDPVICLSAEVNELKRTVTYASVENKIKITQGINSVNYIEPAVGPIELVAKRGQQLLTAFTYPTLREEAQREVVRFLQWATEKDTVMWGSDEVDSPLLEALEVAVAALAQYPANEKLATITLGLLLKLDQEERLERVLVATLKKNTQWDGGFNAMAELLDRQDRAQELYAFVKAWAKTHRGSALANKWLMEQTLLNGDLKLARDAARRLWLRKKDPRAGAELAKIYLMGGKGDKALEVANKVLQIEGLDVAYIEEMKIIAGSSLLAQGKLDEARALLEEAQGSASEKLRTIAIHNLGILYLKRGDARQARVQWEGLQHPASRLALSIVNRRSISDPEVIGHPVLAQTANELNACIALESGNGAQAIQLLKAGRTERQIFLRRVAELLQGNFNLEKIKALNYFSGDESELWRAYAYIQAGEFMKAEYALKDLPEDNGYAAVYRVYCAEGLKESKRAAALFLIAKASKNPPRYYLSEMESHYLTLKSSREREDFKWPAGDVLRTGWISQATKTGVHISAHGDYLSFEGTQAEEGVSRAWRKRSKERLRKIKASFTAARGWSGVEFVDNQGENGIAVAVEYIEETQLIVWRRLADGIWDSVWHELEATQPVGVDAVNTLNFMIDDSLVGNEQIQLLDARGTLTPLGSLSDIPGSHMRVGFFTTATTGVQVDMKVRELIFEVRPKEIE